jgi:glucose/arabinose dehydrogenase
LRFAAARGGGAGTDGVDMKSLRARVIALVVTGLLVCAAGTAGSAATAASGVVPHLPAGFTDTVVAGIPAPVALATTPDGRILVADQHGKVWIIKGGVLLTRPALNISTKVCSNGERGLLGVAVDPNFATNSFVYVYYTFAKFGSCPAFSLQVPVNRVSRFKMVGDKLGKSTEKILVDEIVNYAGNHNAGFVGFGHDGMLYISVGDGGCDYTGVTGCAADNGVSRRDNVLLGKVLRITRNGGIPADNPFQGANTARCNHGPIADGLTCQETYMHGFRNPFRAAFDPNSGPTRLFVNDVGQDRWEEIDEAVKGADYGWNIREGHCVTGSTTDCGAPPAGLTNPIFDYGHGGGCTAITGGAFVPAGVWPAKFQSGYMYADYVCNKIFRLSPDGFGGWTSRLFADGLAPGGPVGMLFGPHGAKTSLYYTTYANGGEVHVIDKS